MTYPTSTVLDDASEKALRLPVGVTSPLWFMIGSAAVMGAAVFWATRWLRPTNLEAVLAAPAEPEATVEAAVEEADEIVEEAFEAVAEKAQEIVIDPVIEAPVIVAEAVEQAADDLTVMTGIGPKLAASLAERGVTRFAHIAAWTEAEIATLDKEMKLIGRIGREAWVAQAKRLAQG